MLITSLMNAFTVLLFPVLPEDENIAHGLADTIWAMSTISGARLLMHQRLVCLLAPRRHGNDSRPHHWFRKWLSAIRQHYLTQCWLRFMSPYDVARLRCGGLCEGRTSNYSWCVCLPDLTGLGCCRFVNLMSQWVHRFSKQGYHKKSL